MHVAAALFAGWKFESGRHVGDNVNTCGRLRRAREGGEKCNDERRIYREEALELSNGFSRPAELKGMMRGKELYCRPHSFVIRYVVYVWLMPRGKESERVEGAIVDY